MKCERIFIVVVIVAPLKTVECSCSWCSLIRLFSLHSFSHCSQSWAFKIKHISQCIKFQIYGGNQNKAVTSVSRNFPKEVGDIRNIENHIPNQIKISRMGKMGGGVLKSYIFIRKYRPINLDRFLKKITFSACLLTL